MRNPFIHGLVTILVNWVMHERKASSTGLVVVNNPDDFDTAVRAARHFVWQSEDAEVTKTGTRCRITEHGWTVEIVYFHPDTRVTPKKAVEATTGIIAERLAVLDATRDPEVQKAIALMLTPEHTLRITL